MSLQRILIPEEVTELAKTWNPEFVSRSHKITEHHKFWAWVAEIMIWRLHPTWRRSADKQYDFITDDGKKVDVKSIPRNQWANPDYDCDVQAHQIGYKIDYYYFTSINKQEGIIEVFGAISKDMFNNKAEFIPKGTVMGNGNKSEDDRYRVSVEWVLQNNIEL